MREADDLIYYRGVHPSEYDAGDWREACARPELGVAHEDMRAELEALYRHMPLGESLRGELPVFVEPGQSIQRHRHPEYTGIFYVDPVGTPLLLAGGGIMPDPWEFIVLDPMVWHATGENRGNRRRLSVVLRVENGHSRWKSRDSAEAAAEEVFIERGC